MKTITNKKAVLILKNKIKVIAGLGNQGLQYSQTRHNVGFIFLNLLAETNNLVFKDSKRLNCSSCKIKVNGEECHLIKPLTYMNNSGLAVRRYLHFFKINREDLLVVHDELDFEAGLIRLKKSGGHAGHNGIRSIISNLNGDDFFRLRIGIGRPKMKEMVADYVLSKPSKDEERNILNAMMLGVESIKDIVAGNVDIVFRRLHGI